MAYISKIKVPQSDEAYDIKDVQAVNITGDQTISGQKVFTDLESGCYDWNASPMAKNIGVFQPFLYADLAQNAIVGQNCWLYQSKDYGKTWSGAGISSNTLQEDFVVGFIDIDRGINSSKFEFSVDQWSGVFKAIVNKEYSAGDASGHVKVRLYRLGCPESNVDMYEISTTNQSRHVLVIDTKNFEYSNARYVLEVCACDDCQAGFVFALGKFSLLTNRPYIGKPQCRGFSFCANGETMFHRVGDSLIEQRADNSQLSLGAKSSQFKNVYTGSLTCGEQTLGSDDIKKVKEGYNVVPISSADYDGLSEKGSDVAYLIIDD